MCNITADLRHEDHIAARVFHDRPCFALRHGDMPVDEPAMDPLAADAQPDKIAFPHIAHPQGKVIRSKRHALDDPSA